MLKNLINVEENVIYKIRKLFELIFLIKIEYNNMLFLEIFSQKKYFYLLRILLGNIMNLRISLELLDIERVLLINFSSHFYSININLI